VRSLLRVVHGGKDDFGVTAQTQQNTAAAAAAAAEAAKERPGGSTNTLVSCLIIVERLQVHDYVLYQ